MRILVALIAVFMVSGAVAQKKPTGFTSGGNWTCGSDAQLRDGASIWTCKDPKNGKTQKVQCKNPPKSIMPPKDRPTVMTMAKLKKACGLLDGLEDIDSNG